MTGRIFHEDNPSAILYTIAGNWKKSVTITDVKTGVSPIHSRHQSEGNRWLTSCSHVF